MNRLWFLPIFQKPAKATLRYIQDDSGNSFSRVSERTADYEGWEHYIEVNDYTINSDIEFSYKMKQDGGEQYKSSGKLVVQHGGGASYISCVSSCHVPNDDWMIVGGRCNIADDNEDNIDLGSISSIKVSISGTASETGAALPNLYLDDVSVKLYERDLSWVPTAEQRINFFRKIAVDFDVQTSGADKIEVKMTKNHFPFGATFHHQMIEEMADYENWFDVFNFGVARNAMKWMQQERQPGVIDWKQSDGINDIFFQARMKNNLFFILLLS